MVKHSLHVIRSGKWGQEYQYWDKVYTNNMLIFTWFVIKSEKMWRKLFHFKVRNEQYSRIVESQDLIPKNFSVNITCGSIVHNVI